MMEPQSLSVKNYRVSGLVQGVFYRASAADKARELHLRGWVLNLPSGEVEARAAGTQAALREFADWLHEGPPAARVEAVAEADLTDEADAGSLPFPFEIRH